MDYRDNLLSNLKIRWIQTLEKTFQTREATQLTNRIIQHYLGLSRTDQAIYRDYRLSESEILHLYKAVNRLLKEEPIQYVFGISEFYGLRLMVNPSVLIPRPETEELVDLILKENKQKEPNILDIGTGSGCIALALKSHLPHAKIKAIDISEGALSVARNNARNNQLEVDFCPYDILNPPIEEQDRPFDIIVSNPPYVTETDKQYMEKNVLEHEPSLALFVGDDDPLLFYRHIADYAKKSLKEGGLLYLEANEKYCEETARLLKNNGFKQIFILQDINGKNRFITACK